MKNFVVSSEEKSEMAANLLTANNQTLEHIFIFAKTEVELTSRLRSILPLVGRHLTYLQSIGISVARGVANEEVNEDIAVLINKQISCLHKIELYDLPVGICGVIAEPLLNNSHLKTLTLSCGLGDDDAEILAGVLRNRHCPLNALNLLLNNIGDRGCCAIMDALHHNSSLTVLDFYGNNIGVEGGRATARALQNKSVTLQELDLHDNRDIGDDGCIYIAAALRENASLRKLDLGDCWIFREGWKAMGLALQKNYTLHELCSTSYHDKQFRNLLRINREKPVQAQATKTGMFPTHLLSFSMRHNSSAACNAEMLSKIVSYENLSVVFSFIQECPAIFES